MVVAVGVSRGKFEYQMTHHTGSKTTGEKKNNMEADVSERNLSTFGSDKANRDDAALQYYRIISDNIKLASWEESRK